MTHEALPLDAVQQRRHDWLNTVHTWLLIAGSTALTGLIAWAVSGTTGLIWAVLFTAFGLWSVSRVSPAMVLKLYEARPLAEAEAPELHRLMRELTRRADLPAVPQLHYVPSKMMNAFAVGRPEDAAIAVTDGLIRGLSLRQLSGVLAHEVSHIRNGDLKVMALGDVLTRMTSTMSTFGLLLLLPAYLLGAEVPLFVVLALAAAPTLGGLLQLALSRTREYDADLDAAGLTGDPEALASALLTLERKQGRLWEGLVLPGGRIPDPSILRSHPKTSDRVARLLSLRPTGTPAVVAADAPHRPGPSIVPVIRPPRIHALRMGLWY